MLHLHNFDLFINPGILQRGKQYYGDKAVKSLKSRGEGVWRAKVEGTDMYQVEVMLDDQKGITGYSCTCPYDGGICKHVVAVLLAMRKAVKAGPGPETTKQQEFEKLLQNIGAKDYQAFVKYYAALHEEFLADFKLFFAGKDEQANFTKKYRKQVRRAINTYSYQGEISYQDVGSLAQEIYSFLEAGDAYLAGDKPALAFALAGVVLEEMMEVIAESEGPEDAFVSLIDDAIRLMGLVRAAAKNNPDLQEQMLTFLEAKLKDSFYFGYGDFGYELFLLFKEVALDLNKPEIALRLIDAKLDDKEREDYKEDKEFYLVHKIDLLTSLGRSQEADNLVWENLDLVKVRRREVDKALDRQDYGAAKNLIDEGIRVAQTLGQPAIMLEWQKQLLRLAVITKDTGTIRRYARQFAFDKGFDLENYQLWKSTFPGKEWAAVIGVYIAGALKELQGKNKKPQAYAPTGFSRLQTDLAQVLIQEKAWDHLLVLVLQSPDLNTLLLYHEYLAPHYPAELLALYLPALEAYADQTISRPEYAQLAATIKMLVKTLPTAKEELLQLARRLQQKHARRRAMVEELNVLLH